jgi:Family of unknown function (DUF6477)
MRKSTDRLNATPFLMPLHRPPRVTPHRIVGFRPAVTCYDRAVDLARLLPLWPEELADCSIAGRTKLVQMLERALRAERQRGVGGHWTYDLTRHAALLSALRAERAALRALTTPRIRAPFASHANVMAKHCRPPATSSASWWLGLP